MTSEALIQQQIVVFFRNKYCLKHHNPRCSIFSVPNEAKFDYNQKIKLQTGLLSGVSDLIILQPNKCIFIEVKTSTGKQSDKQKDFEQMVKDLGFEYFVVRSLEDFKSLLK